MNMAQCFLDTLRRRDFVGLRAMLDDSVWCRAMLVREVVEHHSADDVIAMFTEWYGTPSAVEMVEADQHAIMGREFVRYRMRLRPPWRPDQWHLVEQSGYLTVSADRIRRIDLACTGFYALG